MIISVFWRESVERWDRVDLWGLLGAIAAANDVDVLAWNLPLSAANVLNRLEQLSMAGLSRGGNGEARGRRDAGRTSTRDGGDGGVF